MGNQIVCPSGQNWYLEDFNKFDLKIDRSIFDGTFSLSFRVMSKGSDEPNVVKAYKIPGEEWQEEVEKYTRMFISAKEKFSQGLWGNVISTPQISAEGAYLCRPYLDNSLSERIMFNPPFTLPEKKWLAFQLFQAVENMNSASFTHGDIKPENIFITDSLYLQLVDHAPFKPHVIRPNRPNYFIHFFSYFRSCCFLAPERISFDETQIDEFSADIFSAACVVAFLFLNGKYLFNFTTVQQLDDEKGVEELERIEDNEIRNLLKKLIVRDVAKRQEAFAHWKESFPEWFGPFYSLFCTVQQEKYARVLVGTTPQIMCEIPSDAGDYFVIFLNLATDFLLSENSQDDFPFIIPVILDVTKRLHDPFLKLSHGIPHLIALLDHNNTFLSCLCFDAVMDILKTIEKAPPETEAFASVYLMSHILKSLENTWKINCISRLPTFICEVGRLWPSVLPTIINNEKFMMHLEENAHIFMQETTKRAPNCKYCIFECFYTIALRLTKSQALIPDVVSFMQTFYTEMTFVDKQRVIRTVLQEFIGVLCSMYETCNDEERCSILGFFLFAMSHGILRECNMSQILKMIHHGFRSRSMEIRATVRMLLAHLPENYRIMASAYWVSGLIDRSPKLARASRRPAFRPESVMAPRTDRHQIDYVVRSDLVYGQKLFDGYVHNIFANPDGDTLIIQHSNSNITSVALDWKATPKLSQTKTVSLTDKIHFSVRTNSNDIVLVTNNSVSILDSSLETRSNFETSDQFHLFEPFYQTQIITTQLNSTELRVHDLSSFQIVSTFDIGDNYPVCMTNHRNHPFSFVGTDTNIVYTFDMRTNTASTVCPFTNPRKIVPFSESLNFAVFSEDEVKIYDARMNKYRMKVTGMVDLGFEFDGKLILLNKSGTFMVDPDAENKVKVLIDNRVNGTIPKAGEADYELPNKYRTSLHGHMFQITACDVMKNICVSSDCAGYVNLWSPKRPIFCK